MERLVLDTVALRERSVGVCAALGYPTPPPHLPCMWDPAEGAAARPVDEVVARLLVLNVDIDLAFGTPPAHGTEWIAANGLDAHVSPTERARLEGAPFDEGPMRAQVEALWALAWVLGLTPDLELDQWCGDHLSSLLPDLRSSEDVASWRARTTIAPVALSEQMTVLDALYCLSWGARDTLLRRGDLPGDLEWWVHFERRKALDWAVIGDEGPVDWDDIGDNT